MKVLIYALSVLGAFSLISCDETARLAKELPGTWAGTPENFTDNSAVTATIIETVDVSSDPASPSKDSRGSDLTIVGMLSANTQVIDESPMAEPLGLTVSGRSVINGTWSVIDDDEVAVSLDLSTLKVEIDPDAVTVSGVIPGQNTPRIDSIRPSVASSVARSISIALSNRYSSVRNLDDVKVKEPLLKFEIGHTDYVFTRQVTAQ